MKDFKDSLEQKTWDAACNSHERIKEFVALFENRPGEFFSQRLAYWRGRLEEIEARYPSLAKKI